LGAKKAEKKSDFANTFFILQQLEAFCKPIRGIVQNFGLYFVRKSDKMTHNSKKMHCDCKKGVIR